MAGYSPWYSVNIQSPVNETQMVVELERLLGRERVLSGAAVSRAYDCDAYTIDKNPPACVVFPESTEDVQSIVRWCNEHQVPFTPRGAGTGLSGGALPALGGVLVSTKKLNRILEVDVANRRIRAQAGAVNLHLTKAVSGHGLHFAPDPSSQTVSTLGGNIAENSGGPHTLKYGVTVQHVLSVTMVDSRGEIVVFDDAPGYDLLGVVVGSEGTLGIVTDAWVRLTPNPERVETALASFDSTRIATQVVAVLIAEGTIPAALEMIDEGCLKAVLAAFPLDVPPGTKALLLIECDGTSEEAQRDIAQVVAVCSALGALRVDVAQNEAERTKLWTARKKGIGAMGRLAPTIVTHDGVIPRSKLPEMLEYVYEVAREHGLGVGNMFHAGDGNLHPIFYFDDREQGRIEAVVRAGEKVIAKCIELGGSASGEHGIGVEKSSLLKLMFDENDMRLQEDVRSIFKPGPLCNPCKVIPDQKGCVEHMRRWRGAAN